MHWASGLLALGLIVVPSAAYAQGTATRKAKPHTSAAQAPAKSGKAASTRAIKGHLNAAVRARRTTSSRSSRTRRAPVPSYQLHPDPQRYQQIQQALTDRGYFKGPVNGEWTDDSVAALRQFQLDQKLDGEGKIDALTLRGLGLGPKHDGSTAPLSGGIPSAHASTTPAESTSQTPEAQGPELPPQPQEVPPPQRTSSFNQEN